MLAYLLALKLTYSNMSMQMKAQSLLCILRDQAAQEIGQDIEMTQFFAESTVYFIVNDQPFDTEMNKLIRENHLQTAIREVYQQEIA